jgi:hypothetical protein
VELKGDTRNATATAIYAIGEFHAIDVFFGAEINFDPWIFGAAGGMVKRAIIIVHHISRPKSWTMLIECAGGHNGGYDIGGSSGGIDTNTS